MTAELIFIVQALVILVLPAVVWRGIQLRGVIPLVVVQILVGIALGPTLFGRLAPEAFDTVFNPNTLTPLWGVASIAVLLFGFVTGLHLEADAFLWARPRLYAGGMRQRRGADRGENWRRPMDRGASALRGRRGGRRHPIRDRHRH